MHGLYKAGQMFSYFCPTTFLTTFLATSFLSYCCGAQSLSHSSDFRKPISTPFPLSFFFSCFSIPVQVQSLFLFVFCNSHVCNCSHHLLILPLLFLFLLFSPRCIYLILIQLIQRNIGQIYCIYYEFSYPYQGVGQLAGLTWL